MHAPGGKRSLLAIDLGLRCGFACFDVDGAGGAGGGDVDAAARLRWYRSQHFANRTVLKAAIPRVLDDAGAVAVLAVEGDSHLADLWAKLAQKRGAHVLRVAPETWRAAVLLPRQQRSGSDAKEAAKALAAEAIDASEAKRPKTALNDDVCEAICLGLYALQVTSTS